MYVCACVVQVCDVSLSAESSNYHEAFVRRCQLNKVPVTSLRYTPHRGTFFYFLSDYRVLPGHVTNRSRVAYSKVSNLCRRSPKALLLFVAIPMWETAHFPKKQMSTILLSLGRVFYSFRPAIMHKKTRPSVSLQMICVFQAPFLIDNILQVSLQVRCACFLTLM